MPGPSGPAVSIVVPAHNSAGTLARCLAAICAQVAAGDEVTVVDDGSDDDTGRTSARFPVVVHRLERRSGTAAARNRGAALARTALLFFVDADVVLHDGALARARGRMADAGVDAVIGSYDDRSEAPTLVNQFKNLAHHFFHQRAAGVVATFWGACGCVRREVFTDAGGFDERRFTRPSIEDVELGWRMAQRGARIVLDPELQVTHLKRWTLSSLVATDVLGRAIPWARCALDCGRAPDDLNATPDQKIAALLAIALETAALSAMFINSVRLAAVLMTPAIAIAALAINRRLYGLFWRKGGARLLFAGFALQQLYYTYAVAGFAVGLLLHCAGKRLPTSAPPAAARC